MADSKSRWKIAAASVIGFDHAAKLRVCEDAYSVEIVGTECFVAVVADGAGSAIRSSEGALIGSGCVAERLAEALKEEVLREKFFENSGVAEVWVEDAIQEARSRISNAAQNGGSLLQDFHATLLGALASPYGGLFFHIGDGAGCAFSSTDYSRSVLSIPENGEYANETFFFTQPSWYEHLRFTKIDAQFDVITLMTDGVTPFALESRMSGPAKSFFRPVTEYLSSHSRGESEEALQQLLTKEQIRRITGDDKTIVWAMREYPVV